MRGETGIYDNPTGVLLLTHLPSPQPKVKIDRAKLLYSVAIMHKMAIADKAERKNAKYLERQAFNPSGKDTETRSQIQMIASNDIAYWITSLEAAKKAAREACEKDLGNLKYLKFLAELEEIII